MAKVPLLSDFIVERDQDKCISCQVCCRMCAFDGHCYDPETEQVSTDPLREPMELRTYIGRKPECIEIDDSDKSRVSLKNISNSQMVVETPILFSAMSYGSISLNACRSLARAASEFGTFYNTGEGGLHRELYKSGKNTIVQVASGRFGVHAEYLNAGGP